MLGTQLDRGGKGPARWEKWRPTVSVAQHEDLIVSRLELLHGPSDHALAEQVAADVAQVSPETEVVHHTLDWSDPWDFEAVYAVLHDFARAYPFRPQAEDYLVHITTGTHVAQICLFLLTESRHLPGRLLQTSPPRGAEAGRYAIVDLDLSKYDRLAARFRREQKAGLSFLKSGIDTKNAAFNRLIERIEQVAIASRAPLLLLGPTGAGKSVLARRIFELKQARNQLDGPCVEVNCATLRGDAAMSTLFGHVRGAFTGAMSDRAGLLQKANRGVLFLDEIGELGLDEQAMLLHAIEEKVFYPVGADREVRSDFQLIAGTNRELAQEVRAGRFREDLLARLNLWTFQLPPLRERAEDIAPNLDFELEAATERLGRRITFSKEARARFLAFATSAEARWPANFRDFAAAVLRMATLAPGGRVDVSTVEEEIDRLRAGWASTEAEAEAEAEAEPSGGEDLEAHLGSQRLAELDRFERVQLREVIRICRQSPSLSAAGRALFDRSRRRKQSTNDADRLRKYLLRYGLAFESLRG
ncbi:MAG: sigma 54-interacting transcriptional regulator [Deltaproteobacteria bacterium]|nr:sigma 54-interacting transcriptional regulator [Deltaproteobacteria bacterium]